ncbi:TAXI family TRAP transporter solute-binding subunit [Aminobacterium sp. EBM-42]|jgi:TRAP transporter TAXI family solute receptor|uniref:TAXI family TRAP transporter solute-binding subunit n=1 Tax=Aminobacterium sp. EBM-42 TaxID=1918503 RepID=UPI00257B5C7A|nr:TAXI family TRAP transporter solute-binding subunit [Aminobacterium sp. EBM-42]
MSKINTKLVRILSVLLCIFLFSGIGLASGGTKYLKIATGTVGGTWFSGGSVLASIITEKVEGANASPTIGGGVSNCRDVDANRAQIGYSYSGTALDAWEGRVPFEKPLKNLRYIGNQYIEPFHILFLKEQGFKSLDDLKGKSFSPGKEGFTGKIVFDRLLEEANISYDMLGKATYVGFPDGALLMKDKHLDFYAILTMPPNSAFMDVDTFSAVDILQLPEDLLNRMAEKYGMEKWIIPAGAYSGVKNDITTVGYGGGFYCNKDLPEDLVYEITKALWENYERFVDAAPASFKSQIKLENALRGTVLPLHEGAYRFYKEKGMEIPEAGMPLK